MAAEKITLPGAEISGLSTWESIFGPRELNPETAPTGITEFSKAPMVIESGRQIVHQVDPLILANHYRGKGKVCQPPMTIASPGTLLIMIIPRAPAFLRLVALM